MKKTAKKFDRKTRRAQIVQAALRIIGSRGVGALTTAAIAKEVGISEANLYRHFENKEEILNAMTEEIGAGLEENLKAVTAGSPVARLKEIYKLHLEYIEKNDGIPRLVFSEQLHMRQPHIRKKLLEKINAYSRKLSEIIKEGQEGGLIKKGLNPHAASMILIGMVQITTLKWSLSGFSFSLVHEGMKLWKDYEKCLK
ncbi:MAG TPA: TetR/AcrR family transcriptional regulator [Nitrospirae bacterium]|nr:TetR/AcrR family transcriptional regulator [Nitrospirota bacterium]